MYNIFSEHKAKNEIRKFVCVIQQRNAFCCLNEAATIYLILLSIIATLRTNTNIWDTYHSQDHPDVCVYADNTNIGMIQTMTDSVLWGYIWLFVLRAK